MAVLGGLNGPDNKERYAEKANEAENAKQMSAYKHLLSPGLYVFSISASK